jgi:hypothetical protein
MHAGPHLLVWRSISLRWVNRRARGIKPGVHFRVCPGRGQAMPSAVAVGSALEISQHGLHLIDLRLLTRDDAPAKFLGLTVREAGLLAHQDRSSVMRDHRLEELIISDCSLLPDRKPERQQSNHARGSDPDVQPAVVLDMAWGLLCARRASCACAGVATICSTPGVPTHAHLHAWATRTSSRGLMRAAIGHCGHRWQHGVEDLAISGAGAPISTCTLSLRICNALCGSSA